MELKSRSRDTKALTTYPYECFLRRESRAVAEAAGWMVSSPVIWDRSFVSKTGAAAEILVVNAAVLQDLGRGLHGDYAILLCTLITGN